MNDLLSDPVAPDAAAAPETDLAPKADTSPPVDPNAALAADTSKSWLDDLPDDQRITAVLRDVEGYDYSEIAEITSSSLGTVKSRLSRARNKLRDCLQGFRELLPAQYRLQISD